LSKKNFKSGGKPALPIPPPERSVLRGRETTQTMRLLRNSRQTSQLGDISSTMLFEAKKNKRWRLGLAGRQTRWLDKYATKHGTG
jgi:hypothetical protein